MDLAAENGEHDAARLWMGRGSRGGELVAGTSGISRLPRGRPRARSPVRCAGQIACSTAPPCAWPMMTFMSAGLSTGTTSKDTGPVSTSQ